MKFVTLGVTMKPRARRVTLGADYLNLPAKAVCPPVQLWKVTGKIVSPSGVEVTVCSNLRKTLEEAWQSYEKVLAYYSHLWGVELVLPVPPTKEDAP